MRIAIIEDNIDYTDLLKLHFNPFRWDADFFTTSEEFGKTNLNEYDVIIADYMLPNSANGRDLLKGIQSKTSAELFLMSAYPDVFIDADIQNNNINGFIDKMNIQNVIEILKYCDAKLRINRLIKSEKEKFESIISNGFKMEIYNDTIILKITEVLQEASKRKIEEQIDRCKITKIIVSYPQTKVLRSLDLGVIVSLYNTFKNKKVRMVFWNMEKDSNIKEQLILCKLGSLFPILDTMEECIYELSEMAAA